MPTSTQSEGKKSGSSKSTSKSSASQQDAIALLKADHREVEKLFGQFEKASGDARKRDLARKICMELRVHTRIEEEIFYPQCREQMDEEELLNEAQVEHDAAKDLIEQIEAMEPSDEMFDAKVSVLKEQIEHHVEEEEKELFPKVRKSDLDLKAIGQQLKSRKMELMREMKDGGVH